ncbi:MAG: precorrin-6y C5,15-methyltransferase (decarboxylating) subunit CbiE [Clostridia bacterium]|nr:precorrin-6y C5,15-methyltransferase (decarboxylating) subunit CbiE [Clostridia bacterium]
MNKLRVVGAGPGSMGLMTREGVEAVQSADCVWCAARMDELIDPQKRRPLVPFKTALDDMAKALESGLECVALLSGDTGLYSMLPMLIGRFGSERVSVIPGISSVQVLCAAAGTTWQDAKIVSAHGREMSAAALCHYARTHAKLIVLLDAERGPGWVRDALSEGGLGHVRLLVGERLSYPEATVAPYEERPYDPLSVCMVLNDAPSDSFSAPGLDDDAFIRGKTPMTKREIRIQALADLKLKPDSFVWDVGAGTGSVSIECAIQCPLGHVYAVERSDEALSLLEQNKARFHASNMTVVPGSAPEALKGLPTPTHVFLGGTGGESAEIIRRISELNAPVRVCATAVTMETASLLAQLMQGYDGFSAAQIGVSRLEKIGRYHMFRAQNPVFVFCADINSTSPSE